MQVISLTGILLCFAVVKSTMYEVYDNNVVIFRGDKDRFTRTISCNESKAVCVDESCVYCQCMEGQTFVQTRGSYGECVSNELLIYATSDEAYFLIQNYRHQHCLYYAYSNRVSLVRQERCSYINWKSYWIWTNNGQLLSWKSLECMTDDYVAKKGIHFIVMKKCDKSNFKQLWKCERTNQTNYIKLKQSHRYLLYGEFGNYATAGHIYWHVKVAPAWARYGSKQDVCSQAVGCETFADGTSIIILNKTKCDENSECLGEKEINLWKTRCSLLSNQSQYLHNDTWKLLEIKNGSFEIEVNMQVSLKWNLTPTPKSWAGLMVKVRFKCEETTGSNVAETDHCVVIKYTGTFKGFYDEDDGYDKVGKDKDGDSDSSGDDGNKDGGGGTDDQTDKNKTNVNQKSNGGDKDNTRTIIITVGVLLALLLAGVAVFIVYKYRNRFFRTRKENAERQDEADQGNNTSGDRTLRNNPMESMELEETGWHGWIQPATEDTHVPPQSPQYEVPTTHQYEYPDQHSHQYEYPSFKSMEADTRGKTDVSVQDGAYSPLLRPPLNKNESENGGYTSLIKDKKTTEKVGSTAKKDEADRLSYVDVTNGDYTPLVRPPLKDKESEDGCYTSLIKNEKTNEKADSIAKKNEACELPYVDAINGDYTPLAKLKLNECEIPVYQPLLKNRQKQMK